MKNRTFKNAPKRGLIMVFAMVCSLGLYAQTLTEASVPAKARQALKSSVPAASPTWSAGPDATFEAKFDNNGQTLVYVFDKNGLLNEKKQLCLMGGLPELVSTSLASAYPGVEHQAAYKVITRQRQRYFDVVIPGRGTLDYMRFDVSGTPVGKTSLALAEQPIPTRMATAENAALGLDPDAVAETTVEEVEQVEPVYNPIAVGSMPMRGESSNTVIQTEVDLSDEINIEEELMDDDLKDLLDDSDEKSLDELLNDDEDDWEDIDLLEDLDDEDDWEDIDLLD
jgi:hypothetical protein